MDGPTTSCFHKCPDNTVDRPGHSGGCPVITTSPQHLTKAQSIMHGVAI